jgi:hypothetical protein
LTLSGVANLDSGVGVYAPDAESYTTFKELFDPIIQVSCLFCAVHTKQALAQDYHGGFSPSDRQPAVDLGDNQLDKLPDLDPSGEYIISTRIRCGRSFKGYQFNPCLTEEVFYLVLRIRSFMPIPAQWALRTYHFCRTTSRSR